MDKKPSSIDGRVHCVPDNLDDLPCKNCLLRFGGGYLCSPHAVHWNGGTPAEWVVTDRETTCLAFKDAIAMVEPSYEEACRAFEWYVLLPNLGLDAGTIQMVYEAVGTDLSSIVYFYRKSLTGDSWTMSEGWANDAK